MYIHPFYFILYRHYPTMLNALSPLFNNQTIPNTVDNAAGAIARLILAHPNSVPLDQVLPTFTNALPLKADFEENQAVFDCIFKLFEVQNQFVSMIYLIIVGRLLTSCFFFSLET
jgi:hypothetical protein